MKTFNRIKILNAIFLGGGEGSRAIFCIAKG